MSPSSEGSRFAICPACGEMTELVCGFCGTSFRSGAGDQSGEAGGRRDLIAETRDRAAESRDRIAEDRDVLAGQDEPQADYFESRGELRVRSQPVTSQREDAAHDREDSAHDRQDSSHDRHASAGDRTDAWQDRAAAANAAERAVETLESMTDAFFTLDRDWRFTYLNPQTEVILGRPREELVGRVVWEEFPEAGASVFAEQYRRALREQVPVRFEEAYEPLGRTLEVRAYPVPSGLAIYFTDVTDERLREARRRQSDRLETLGKVTAGVAHDFNNLLMAVGGFAQLGQAVAPDTTSIGYFDEIESASEKGRAMTRQLLTFAREQELSPVVVDLNEVVAGLSSLLRQLVPSGIEIVINLPLAPVPVFVDRSQLEQVLLNLVVNSRDAIDAAGSITLSTMNDAPSGFGDEVGRPSGWIQVSDTGSGIPQDVLPQIFDPFFSTKPSETATGLGLATTYGIVRQSGGSIFVESTVGVGTTITVSLPRESTHASGTRA
jgi:PAS domain S-box-containing protein